VVVGREYELQCEVQNVAPVQYLVLRWYRGQTEVYNHSFSELSPATPVQVSSTLLIVPNRADDGAQYRCEAELELGAEGPQPPPTVQSEVLKIAVQCKWVKAPTPNSSNILFYVNSYQCEYTVFNACYNFFNQIHLTSAVKRKRYWKSVKIVKWYWIVLRRVTRHLFTSGLHQTFRKRLITSLFWPLHLWAQGCIHALRLISWGKGANSLSSNTNPKVRAFKPH